MKKERDLFSIGEVARALNITRRAILYYEEFGLIRPDVKDGATGNRYYTIDTFVKLRTIRILQNLGLSLSDVLGYFDGDFALAPLIRRLEAQRDELDRHIESLRERSGAEPPQVKLVRLLPQTVYRRVCAAGHRGGADDAAPQHCAGGDAALRHRHLPPDVPGGVAHRQTGSGGVLRGYPAGEPGGVRGDPAGSASPQSLPPRCV